MISHRLPILLVALVAVLLLRWWDPGSTAAPAGVAQAVVRSTQEPKAIVPSAVAASGPAVATSPTLVADLSAGTREVEQGEFRNAFAVRVPPISPTPPPAPAPPPRPVPVVAAAVAPAVDPTPPPPPLQVIGTWRDEGGASVFIAGPRGVMQARAGDTLLAEYQVTQISAQQVQLKHLPSHRDISLAVPAASPPSRLLQP